VRKLMMEAHEECLEKRASRKKRPQAPVRRALSATEAWLP
jgi:hypothetical protein